jgi:DHA1 family multidrug resistance protein-like MFS transporter
MRNHIRDTAFGHLVRLLSSRRLLKYPDELNPTLWEQCVQKHSTAHPSTSGEHNNLVGSSHQSALDTGDDGEKEQNLDFGLKSAPGLGKGGLDRENDSHENAGGVVLVDWYGPDDPEVSATRLTPSFI